VWVNDLKRHKAKRHGGKAKVKALKAKATQ